MKIFLDENFGITETDLEEVTQDSDGYNILKCYVPSDLVSTYDSFGVYYAAVLPSSRKVGYFALEGQASSDEENYTLYQASLHTSVVSIAGTVQLGLRFLYGDSGDASLKQKTTPVIQFPVRKSVSVNNDILVLDDDQTTTDVLESYKNLLETALATYVTIASLGASVTTATLNATNATITSGTVTTLDSDTATIDDLVVNNSVSMGRLSGTTVGSKSTTLGTNNTASATNAYAEGYQTQASGLNSHAEGNQTKATNSHSHAEGSGTKATGDSSHTEGAYTEANGGTSHAEGYYSVASADSAHAEGSHTIANGVAQHVGGKYNVADTTSLEIIGNGTADNARSNARKLDANGNETLAGDLVYNGNTSLTSKMATKADLNNNNQQITARIFNSINGYFYITGPNATTQYYSDRIYNSTNTLTWLFPSAGGTFALTSQIASAKSELQTQITANADKIDNAINNLRWELGSHTLDVSSDTTTAYTKTVPSGAIGCQINKIGGMSYKYNQLVQNGNFESTDNWGAYSGTISASDNVVTFTMTTAYTGGGNNYMNQSTTSTVVGHTYLSYCEVYIPSSNARLTAVTAGCRGALITPSSQPTDKWFAISGVVTISTANNIFLIAPNTATSVDDYIMARNCMCIDLTAIYGSGNEPTDVATATTELLKRGIDINEYQAYDSGSIRDSAVTSVVSKDSNDTTLDTFTIDSNIQALTGYGWGVNDTCYNYIDYANKKFVQKVIKFTLESTSFTYYGNENVTVSARLSQELYYLIGQQTVSAKNNANSMSSEYPLKNYGQDGGYYFASDNYLRIKDTSITSLQDFVTKYPNGITFLFELATPIETDISEYLDDNSIEVEPNGTLTFNNTYEQAVPSDIDYLIEEVKA